jgi:hypothetical protein
LQKGITSRLHLLAMEYSYKEDSSASCLFKCQLPSKIIIQFKVILKLYNIWEDTKRTLVLLIALLLAMNNSRLSLKKKNQQLSSLYFGTIACFHFFFFSFSFSFSHGYIRRPLESSHVMNFLFSGCISIL